MKNEREFYRCTHCGNIIGFIENSGVDIICCGEPMVKLVPNTTDAAQEKHVPVFEITDNKIKVTVGSTPHPMTEEHHISWIVLAQGNKTTRVKLPVTGAPEAEFYLDSDEPVTIYEYCNLHGLWAVDQ